MFPNSYRLKESDIYDLNFITESNYLKEVKNNDKKTIEKSIQNESDFGAKNYVKMAPKMSPGAPQRATKNAPKKCEKNV